MPPLDVKYQNSRSLTPKGLNTRASLLDSAREVFKEQGYYSASVSEISRRCGLSQGTFYQYFKNKEQLFLELSDLVVGRFWEKAHFLSDRDLSFEERLHQIVRLLFDHIRENLYFHSILGEFELIDPITIGYYDSIARFYRDFFRREAGLGNTLSLDPNLIAYSLIGIAYFQSLDWGPGASVYSPDDQIAMTLELIRKGISGPKEWSRPADLTSSSLANQKEPLAEGETDLSQGQKTRQAILQAAELVFGQNGYNRAGISEITRQAGIAQGTFYVHFRSKKELMESVVRYLSHEMRKELKLVTVRTSDRRDAEREGVLAFFQFLKRHRHIYRVVPECDAVKKDSAMWYYNKLAHGYIIGLREGIEKGEVRDMPVEFTARALMGVYHFLGLKWMVWDASPHAEFPKHLLGEAIHFVLFGIDPA